MLALALTNWDEIILPGLAIFAVVVLRMVKMMIAHQQAMAKIINENQTRVALPSELDDVRGDLRRLQDAMHQQAIALDNVRGMLALQEPQRPPAAPTIEERLGQVTPRTN